MQFPQNTHLLTTKFCLICQLYNTKLIWYNKSTIKQGEKEYMGLDNYIKVKRNEYTNTIPKLKHFEESWDKKHEYDFSICYWRKCWNIRHEILYILGDISSDRYENPVDAEAVDQIISFLGSLNKKNWTDHGSSIWTWDEYKSHIKQNIKDLKTLRKLMKKYDLEVVFIDSY